MVHEESCDYFDVPWGSWNNGHRAGAGCAPGQGPQGRSATDLVAAGNNVLFQQRVKRGGQPGGAQTKRYAQTERWGGRNSQGHAGRGKLKARAGKGWQEGVKGM
jgi:hypothetical protein